MKPLVMHEPRPAIAEFPNAISEATCARVIEKFEREPGKAPGIVYTPDGRQEVDRSLKRSTDFRIGPDSDPEWLEIDRILSEGLQRALQVYTASYEMLPKLPTTFCAPQIQRTQVGEGFDWHSDEDLRRRLAIIYYFNDDFVGGETEFRSQEYVHKPRRGSLLFFPPYWTHVHRGRNVEQGTKYIATAFLLHA